MFLLVRDVEIVQSEMTLHSDYNVSLIVTIFGIYCETDFLRVGLPNQDTNITPRLHREDRNCVNKHLTHAFSCLISIPFMDAMPCLISIPFMDAMPCLISIPFMDAMSS